MWAANLCLFSSSRFRQTHFLVPKRRLFSVKNEGYRIRMVETETKLRDLLPGAQFADSYAVNIDNIAVNARQVTEAMLSHPPRWIDALMALRNLLVSPFGLKAPTATRAGAPDAIWIFPIVSETPDRLVAGFDDRHLDFRVIVDVSAGGRRRRVKTTTLVRTHNRLGRAYLTVVLPFHKIIVKSLLRQVAAYY
jgi:hypothetical protein